MSNFKKVLNTLSEKKNDVMKDYTDMSEDEYHKLVTELKKEGYSVKKIPKAYLNNNELLSPPVEVIFNNEIIGESSSETEAWVALFVKVKNIKFKTKYTLNKPKYRG